MTHEKQELIRSIKVIYNILKNSPQVTCKHFNIGGSHYFQFERNIKQDLTTTVIFDCRDIKDASGMIKNPDGITVEVIEVYNVKGISYLASADIFIPDQILAHLRIHMRVPLEGIREVDNYLVRYNSITYRCLGDKVIFDRTHLGPISLIPHEEFIDIENKVINLDPPPTVDIAYGTTYKIYHVSNTSSPIKIGSIVTDYGD
jgi:hypothetical protein